MSTSENPGTIAQALIERLKSQFVPPFLLAWLAWNHWYLLLIFSSSGSMLERLFLAKSLCFPNDWATWKYGLLWPGFSTLAFICVHPFVNRAILWYSLSRENGTKAMEGRIRDSAPITPLRYELLLTELEKAYQEGSIETAFSRYYVEGTVDFMLGRSPAKMAGEKLIRLLISCEGPVSVEYVRTQLSRWDGRLATRAIQTAEALHLIARSGSPVSQFHLTHLGRACAIIYGIKRRHLMSKSERVPHFVTAVLVRWRWIRIRSSGMICRIFGMKR